MVQVDSLKKEKSTNNIQNRLNETEDIWVKHFHLFKRKKEAEWEVGQDNITTRPASPKLIKAAKKAKKTPQQKKIEAERRAKIKKGMLVSLKTTAFAVSFLFIVFCVAVYAYKNSYSNKAYLGVRILGEELGGKNESEIQNILAAKIKQINLSFEVDGTEVLVKPEEAGIVFDSIQTAKNAVAKGKTEGWFQIWFYPAGSLLGNIVPSAQAFSIADFQGNLNFAYSIDEQKLEEFTQNLSLKFNQDSQNAGLVMQGTEVQVIPAVYGRKIVTDSIKMQLAEAIRFDSGEKISIDVEKVDPAILETETRNSVEKAKTLLNTSVVYTYKGQECRPDKATIGSWIVFETQKENNQDVLVPKIDPKKVYPYIYSLAGKINVPAINKKVTVRNGVESTVDQEGKEGLAVDIDKAASNTATLMNSGKAILMELPTYVVKPKTAVNNILVADWSKYIEVNISTQRMCAYLAGGEQVNCWAVTTGQRGRSTPTGTFLIQRKSGAGGAPGPYGGGVCMPNPPSPYPLCGINYVSTFTSQGHAIHEAWWRSSFGGADYVWNGSHGCVNSTYEIAKFIYYWAPIGTPVIIHY